jgi:transposase
MGPIEVITSVQRRRRWTGEQKRAMVEETEQPDMSISQVARKYEVHPNQLFHWRRLMHEGSLVASLTGEEFAEFSEPIGTVETLYLSHPEVAMLSRTFMEKGLRFFDVKLYVHPDFKEKLKFIRDLGTCEKKSPCIISGE